MINLLDYYKLGQKVRSSRKAQGLSQEQLAAELQLRGLDITQKAISRIETGERVIPDYELLYFAELFQVSLAELLKE